MVKIIALQADWRSVLPRIRIPCLNVVGSKTQCFNAKGVAYVGKHIPKCETVRQAFMNRSKLGQSMQQLVPELH